MFEKENDMVSVAWAEKKYWKQINDISIISVIGVFKQNNLSKFQQDVIFSYTSDHQS